MSWLRWPLQIQSSAQDTGQKGQASANKGKTHIRTRKHARKATKSTIPALPLARVLCSLCLDASSLRPTRCARAQRIQLQAPQARKRTHEQSPCLRTSSRHWQTTLLFGPAVNPDALRARAPTPCVLVFSSACSFFHLSTPTPCVLVLVLSKHHAQPAIHTLC